MGVVAFVQHLGQDSALYKHRDPEKWLWNTETMLALLLSKVGYGVEVLTWQNSRNGQRNIHAPKPWVTPWSREDSNTRRIGSGAIPRSEWEDWWNGGE